MRGRRRLRGCCGWGQGADPRCAAGSQGGTVKIQRRDGHRAGAHVRNPIPPMRRLLVLFLLTLTAFQFAFAGMPGAAVVVPAGGHIAAAEAAPRDAAHCVGHGSAANPAQASPCSTPQACSVCGACQACQGGQQVVLSGVYVGAVPLASVRWFSPAASTRFLSAEREPRFKPPIL